MLMWYSKDKETEPFAEVKDHPNLFDRRAEKGADGVNAAENGPAPRSRVQDLGAKPVGGQGRLILARIVNGLSPGVKMEECECGILVGNHFANKWWIRFATRT